MGFKQKIFVFLAIMLISGYSIFTFLSYNGSKQMLSKEIESFNTELAISNVKFAQQFLENAIRPIESTSKLISTKSPYDRAQISDLIKLGSGASGSKSTFMSFEDNTFADSGDWVPDASYIPTQRSWYTDTKSAGKTVISSPYIDAETKSLVISISSPIINGSDFKGVVASDFLLKVFSDKINELQVKGAHALFINDKGIIVGAKDPAILGKNFKEVYSNISNVYNSLYAK